MKEITTPANGPEVTTLPAPVAPTKKRKVSRKRMIEAFERLGAQFFIIKEMANDPDRYDTNVVAMAAEVGEHCASKYFTDLQMTRA